MRFAGVPALCGAGILLSVLAVPLPAQSRTVRGLVLRDSGTPIGYALVSIASRGVRQFTSPQGRFLFAGLPRGEVTIRVVQIGFEPRDVVVPDSVSVVRVVLTEAAYVLPELAVEGRCTPGLGGVRPSARPLLAQALQAAERVRILERDYPLRYHRFHMTVTIVGESRTINRADTVRSDSRNETGYRTGQVLTRGPLSDPLRLFSVGDLATSEFQKNHCFEYGGGAAGEGGTVRLVFRTRPGLRSADWEGTLTFDRATSILKESYARLVGIPTWSTVESAECRVRYSEVFPTLVLEQSLDCETTSVDRRGERRIIDSRELARFEFLKTIPGTEARDPPG